MHISWNLVADIGGTNARFAAYLADQPEVLYEFHHAVNEYPQFDQVLGVLTAEIEEMCGWRCPRNRCVLRWPAQSTTRSFDLPIATGHFHAIN